MHARQRKRSKRTVPLLSFILEIEKRLRLLVRGLHT